MNRKLVQFILLIAMFMPVSSIFSQWLQSATPYGGHTTSVVLLQSTLYASFNGGGVYKSNDNGATWTDVTNNLGSRYVTTLYVSGTCLWAGAAGILYKSSDRGCTWVERSDGLPVSTSINGFAEIGANMFVATAQGVYMSKDIGQHWKSVSSGLGSPDVAALFSVGSDLYAGSWTAGIYKSTDNGSSWFRASAGLMTKAITAFAAIGDRIFAGGTDGIYISYNSGGYWTFSELGIDQVTSFAVNGNKIIAGGQCDDGSVLAMSNDAGDNWVSISERIAARSIKGIVINGSQIIIGCNYNGICSTTNPWKGWTKINNGITASAITVVATDGDNVYTATKGAGIYLSKDNGLTWAAKNNGLSNGYIHTLVWKGAEMYAGTLDGIFRSADKGETWKHVLDDIPVYSMAYDQFRFYAGAKGRVYQSLDNGRSFYNTSYGIPSNAIVTSLDVKGKTVYAATTAGLYTINNNYTSWTEISKGLPYKNIKTMLLTESGIIVGTYGKGIWITMDNGLHWASITQDNAMDYVESMIIHDNSLFAAAGSKIYRTMDMGKTWECVSSEFPQVNVNKLAYNSSTLFAGLDGVGIWMRPLREFEDYYVCASAVPTTGGTITGTGVYRYGTNVTLTAVPAADYKFYNWTEDGEVVTNYPVLSFKVKCDRKLVANFGHVRDTLTILYANDSHSTLAPLAPRDKDLKGTRGGIARVATAIAMNRQSERNMLTLHAGDSFTGDMFFNEKTAGAELQLLKSIGVDAFTLGNHEFDITASGLLQVLQGTFPKGDALPLLSGNLMLPDELKDLGNFVQPYIIKKVGGLKVGILGLTTPEANYISFPAPAVFDTNIVAIAREKVNKLMENNCDVIILLSHLGLMADQVIAQNVPGINVIIGGHDHYLLNSPLEIANDEGGKTYIVEAQSNYQALGKLKILARGSEVKVLENKIIPMDASVPEQTAIKAIVDGLITDIEKMYGPVYTKSIGTATGLIKEVADSLMYPGKHDTPLGNLIADAFRDKVGTDIAFTAGGATSQPIYQGPIVAADAYRAIGYGFNLGYKLVRFCITGENLWKLLEQSLSTIEMYDEYLPQVSGMQYTYNPNNAPGKRLQSITINGKAVDLKVTYPAASNEYVVGMLQSVMGVELCNIKVLEDLTEFTVLSDYIANLKTISPAVNGRIVAVTTKTFGKDVAKANLLPTDYQLMQNSPNPFNPSTTFEFAIPKDEYVVLKIYNTLGQEVETIFNETMSAGVYKYTWVPKNLASGIYIYQLNAGKFSQAKKLVLMK